MALPPKHAGFTGSQAPAWERESFHRELLLKRYCESSKLVKARSKQKQPNKNNKSFLGVLIGFAVIAHFIIDYASILVYVVSRAFRLLHLG